MKMGIQVKIIGMTVTMLMIASLLQLLLANQEISDTGREVAESSLTWKLQGDLAMSIIVKSNDDSPQTLLRRLGLAV